MSVEWIYWDTDAFSNPSVFVTAEGVRHMILLIVSHLSVAALAIYIYERYWPRLQAVLKQVF